MLVRVSDPVRGVKGYKVLLFPCKGQNKQTLCVMKKIRVAFFVVADLPYILQKVVTDKSTIYELVSKHPSAHFWQRQRIYNHTACLERVLILILMDDALLPHLSAVSNKKNKVLILILMDDALLPLVGNANAYPITRLNPYSDG